MSEKEILWSILQDRPVAYHPDLARAVKSVSAGIFLSQLLYWYGKQANNDGWIYKTQAEMEEETGLTRREQETARRILKERRIIEEKREGLPARIYYKINFDMLCEIMKEYYENKKSDTDKGNKSGNDDTGFKKKRGIWVETSPGIWEEKVPYEGEKRPIDEQERRKEPNKIGGNVQTRMAESCKQDCTNPPNLNGGIRQTNKAIAYNKAIANTEITTENTDIEYDRDKKINPLRDFSRKNAKNTQTDQSKNKIFGFQPPENKRQDEKQREKPKVSGKKQKRLTETETKARQFIAIYRSEFKKRYGVDVPITPVEAKYLRLIAKHVDTAEFKAILEVAFTDRYWRDKIKASIIYSNLTEFITTAKRRGMIKAKHTESGIEKQDNTRRFKTPEEELQFYRQKYGESITYEDIETIKLCEKYGGTFVVAGSGG